MAVILTPFTLETFLNDCRAKEIQLTPEQLDFYTMVFTKMERAEHKANKFALMDEVEYVEDIDTDYVPS
jgi:hypothetical protein